MIYLGRSQAVYAMSPNNPPVAHAPSGSVVRFETNDCYSGKIRTCADRSSLVPWDVINPATGPLYVTEAKAGDVLRVEIQKIEIAEQGVMSVGPNAGMLGHLIPDERTKVLPIRDGHAIFNDKLSIPCKPMIGVIGTAPADTDIPTGTPGAHGSNMDCKRITEGTVLYLPVNVDGALLAMGDLHAAMGDGEIVICGVEIPGAVTVKVDVIKNFQAPLPMLQTDDALICIASAETLDKAAQAATEHMADFLCKHLGFDIHEAGMLLSAACDLRICQMVDPLLTARMELPLWVAEAYGFKMP